MERIDPRTVKHACGALRIAPLKKLLLSRAILIHRLAPFKCSRLGWSTGVHLVLTSVRGRSLMTNQSVIRYGQLLDIVKPAVKRRSKSRRERRKESRPSELLAAALELFVERGFAATRLDEVAARAGVSKGTLYLYFSSKEELFKAVIRSGIVPLIERGERLLEEHQGPAHELMRQIVFAWWES